MVIVLDNALVPASFHRPRPGIGIVDQVSLWMLTNQFDQQAIPQLEPANPAHSDQFMMVLLPRWLCLLLPQQGGCQVPFTRYWEEIAIRFFLWLYDDDRLTIPIDATRGGHLVDTTAVVEDKFVTTIELRYLYYFSLQL